jgi:glycosyltransferase involved in cell wall biosynthesis
MKIYIFCASLRFSGGRLTILRHANDLALRGHTVSVWTQDARPVVDWMELHVPLLSISGINLHRLPPCDICIFDRIRLAAPLVRARLGKVVHFCQAFEGTDVELCLRDTWSERGLRGLPMIGWLWKLQWQIERAYRLPITKIVTHHHLAELIARRFDQIAYYVPYGLPQDVFTPPRVRPSHTPTVLVVGPADIAWKHVPHALRAVQLLKQRMPQVRLIRVAQHPMREAELRMNVTDEYHTMLSPCQMAGLYRRADVLLISSDATEGFGLPVLEAMACGVPCVVTDIPAFRTFAAPFDYARAVPVGDPERMALALQELLQSPDEMMRLRQRGLEVAENYTMQRSHDAMEDVLLTLVAKSNPQQSKRSAITSVA